MASTDTPRARQITPRIRRRDHIQTQQGQTGGRLMVVTSGLLSTIVIEGMDSKRLISCRCYVV